MTKHDFGHVGCPYYEDKLENEVHVIFVPRKSELSSALVYISKGSLQKDKAYPIGTAYYLSKMILSDKFQNELALDNIVAEARLDYSTVTYQLTGTKDIYAALEKLLKRIAVPSYSEKDVESFRKAEQKEAFRREKNPEYVSQRGCVKNLYQNSPILDDIIPDETEGNRIHASALKKYQETYYVPGRITLFLSYDGDPKEVMEKVKMLPFSGKTVTNETPTEIKEVYTTVRNEYSEIQTESTHSYLTYGVKMPLRENLVDKYGQFGFGAYEIMNHCLFDHNPVFLDGLNNIRASMTDYVFEEGGEDSYLLLTFQTEDPDSLNQYLASYFAKLPHYASSSRFKKTLNEYYAKAISNLAIPSSVLYSFARIYPNHLVYPDFINYVFRLNYNTYVRFLEEFKAFRKSICFARKGK